MRYKSIALMVSAGLAMMLSGCTGDKSADAPQIPVNNIETTAKTSSSELPVASAATIAEVERQAQLRMDNFKIPQGMELSLWADETQSQNPAYFYFDSQGRMLMTEIARFTKGVDDIRGHENMTVEDISITSLADRIAMYENHSDERPMSYYHSGDDLIRLLQDTDDDGRADKSQVFSSGYNDVLDGIGAGVIERDGKVYYTNIPNLWVLEDKDNDGVAEKRTSLQDGFGLRISFYGHDMHGLAWGPDGKLYWSIGDRGFNVTTKEGNHYYGPNLGGVFRSDPDGSNIEFFYKGLRNPQELAFDQYGNLFTADNDGDGGDMERINYLVEGGESGWHAGHQSIMSFTERLKLRSHHYTQEAKIPNAWMTQDMWKPRNEKQPEFILPGIGQINGGPSGLVYNPGASFGDNWLDTFFVIHYLGAPAKSYISTFQVADHGASFNMVDNEPFLSGFNAVDLDFGPDGRLYMSEYNYGGWQPEAQGAVYVLKDPEHGDTPRVKQNEQILISDFSQFDIATLTQHLESNHQRIRQRAQFELAKRGAKGEVVFRHFAFDLNSKELSRLHGVWGLSQKAYSADNAKQILHDLMPLLADKNDRVRMQTARAMGDHRFAPAADKLVELLVDKHPRVAMYAAIGIGRLGYAPSIPAVMTALKKVQDKDLWLRHGLVMALYGIPKQEWIGYRKDSSPDVRLAVLLALRKLDDPQIAEFLDDKQQMIVDEAITAINDNDIIQARPALARHLGRYINADKSAFPNDPVGQFQHHRIINANYNEGGLDDAKRLLAYTATPNLPTSLAAEALAAIEAWQDVNPIDTTTGLPSQANQQRADIQPEVKQAIADILNVVQGQALVQTMRLAKNNGIVIPDHVLLTAVENTQNSAAIRTQALSNLTHRTMSGLQNVVEKLTHDDNNKVRSFALVKLFEMDKKQGLVDTKRYLQSDLVTDRQAALRVLESADDSPAITQITLQLMQALLDNQVNAGTILEVLDLARSRNNSEVKTWVEKYDAKMANADVLTQYAGSVYGGNAKRGEELFSGGGASECMRCHIINWKGGKVGPDLSNIGDVRSADYLLQALVDPSAKIAPGYGTITLTLANGDTISGLYMQEDDQKFTLQLNDGTTQQYSKADLQDIQRPMSGMPPMNYLLTPYEIRDIVAYLKNLKLEHPTVEKVH